MTTEVLTEATDEITMTTEILTEENMTTAGPEGSTESATAPHREPPVTGLHDWPADIRALQAENFLLASERDSLQATKAELTAELTAAVTSAEASITNLAAERDSAQAALTNLATERDSLERRVSQLDTEYDTFKKQVVDVASRYAEDNDWCSVIDNALNELGLERKTTVYEGVITITVAFHAELSRGKSGLPSRSWVRDSLSLLSLRDAIQDSLEFDADHESGEIDSVEFAISGLEIRN